jgi:hypothetical protein
VFLPFELHPEADDPRRDDRRGEAERRARNVDLAELGVAVADVVEVARGRTCDETLQLRLTDGTL